MNPSNTVKLYREGEPRSVREVESWIRQAAHSFRSKLGDDIDDLVQTVHRELIGLVYDPSFAVETSFKALVWRMTNHRAIDATRRQQRRQVEPLDFELVSGDPPALDSMLDLEAAQLIARVMMQSKQACREIWQLIIEGQSYKAMSERLGLSEGALRVKALRCRQEAQALRAKLLKNAVTKNQLQRPTQQGDTHDL